ncbi:MAG TPA: hypothetical protein VG123_13860, partial [Streptosporangiaceae bacterium]|nr:hypothetical protein [Streptosporangiaceae bacterium]
ILIHESPSIADRNYAQDDQFCGLFITVWHARVAAQIGGYARASYASGGGGASRVPRIAGGVTGSALVSCVLVGYVPCAERRRF